MLIKTNEGDLPQPALALEALCLKDILKVNRCNLSFWSVRKKLSSNASVLRTIYKAGCFSGLQEGRTLVITTKGITSIHEILPQVLFSPNWNSTWRNNPQKFPPCMHRASMPPFLPEQYSSGTQWGCDKVICKFWIRPSHSCSRFGSASRTHATKLGWTTQGSSNTGGTQKNGIWTRYCYLIIYST